MNPGNKYTFAIFIDNALIASGGAKYFIFPCGGLCKKYLRIIALGEHVCDLSISREFVKSSVSPLNCTTDVKAKEEPTCRSNANVEPPVDKLIVLLLVLLFVTAKHECYKTKRKIWQNLINFDLSKT